MALSPDFDWSALEGIDWSQIETPEAWEALVRERFPSVAWALDHEELKPVIAEAVEKEFTADTFISNLHATEWWTSRTEAQRSYDIFAGAGGNKAELADRLADQRRTIERTASEMGLEVGAETLDSLAERSLRNALDEYEIAGALLDASTNVSPGALSAAEAAVKDAANSYLVSVTDKTVQDLARSVFRGEINSLNVEETMRDLAMDRHPGLRGLIERGVSPREYFSPHRQRLADMLGRSPENVDLLGEFSSVLEIGDGGESRPMTVSETERYARTLDEYWTRPGGPGESEAFAMVNGLASAFGRRR